MSTIRVLITAGGTREAIDDVRVVSNLSTGRFGIAIAKAFADLGCATTLLGSTKVNAVFKRGQLDPRLEFIPFDSFQDLKTKLEKQSQRSYDYVLMAAAVSDYTPIRHTGKMSSSPETTTITMTKNPKLLSSLSERFGEECSVIGFKLLSGVSREELVSVARNQLLKAKLLMTVANDLSELSENAHPVMLVEADKETRLTGHRNDVAPQIARILCERLGQGQESIRKTLFIPEDSDSQVFKKGQSEGEYSAVFTALPKLNFLVKSQWPQVIDAGAIANLESETVLQKLGMEAEKGRYLGGSFALRTPNSTTLLGFIIPPLSLNQRPKPNVSEFGGPVQFQPLLQNNRISGLVLSGFNATSRDSKEIWFTEESAKNELIIDRIIEYCIEQNWNILGNTENNTVELFTEQGYLRLPMQSVNTRLLRAPRQRSDLQRAGSICLFNPVERTVLLGRRLTPPWIDHWCFPGGKVENEESALEAARREITEETGLSAPNWDPVSSRTVFVGSESERAYEVTNYQFISIDNTAAIKSDELEASWHSIDRVMELAPMGAGTKRILRHVLRLFR